MSRTKLGRLLPVAPLLVAGQALGAPRPISAAVTCNGADHDNPTFANATIKSDLVVPPGRFCRDHFSTVRGGITIGEGAYFDSWNTDIRGR